jgi:hypothetical protein
MNKQRTHLHIFFQQLTNKLLKSNGFVNNFLFQQLERHRVGEGKVIHINPVELTCSTVDPAELPVPSTAQVILIISLDQCFVMFHSLIFKRYTHCAAKLYRFAFFRHHIYAWNLFFLYSFAVATASALTPEREESSGSAAAAAALDTSVLQRGYRFFGQVIHTALPIQAMVQNAFKRNPK